MDARVSVCTLKTPPPPPPPHPQKLLYFFSISIRARMFLFKAGVATPIGHPQQEKKYGTTATSAPALSLTRAMEEGMGMEEGLPDKRARVGIARLGHSHGNLEVLQGWHVRVRSGGSLFVCNKGQPTTV